MLLPSQKRSAQLFELLRSDIAPVRLAHGLQRSQLTVSRLRPRPSSCMTTAGLLTTLPVTFVGGVLLEALLD
eukprot:11189900-Lingulodinium_polyedra.AAC.1